MFFFFLHFLKRFPFVFPRNTPWTLVGNCLHLLKLLLLLLFVCVRPVWCRREVPRRRSVVCRSAAKSVFVAVLSHTLAFGGSEVRAGRRCSVGLGNARLRVRRPGLTLALLVAEGGGLAATAQQHPARLAAVLAHTLLLLRLRLLRRLHRGRSGGGGGGGDGGGGRLREGGLAGRDVGVDLNAGLAELVQALHRRHGTAGRAEGADQRQVGRGVRGVLAEGGGGGGADRLAVEPERPDLAGREARREGDLSALRGRDRGVLHRHADGRQHLGRRLDDRGLRPGARHEGQRLAHNVWSRFYPMKYRYCS
eukprot:Rhum_TRINITY_DN15381_c2_g1::Rhum_TRINITY_DN15381_c2_g1_i1::g.154736::m.154736